MLLLLSFTKSKWTELQTQNFLHAYRNLRKGGSSKTDARRAAQFNVIPTEKMYAESVIKRGNLPPETVRRMKVIDDAIAYGSIENETPAADFCKLHIKGEDTVDPNSKQIPPPLELSDFEKTLVLAMRTMSASIRQMVKDEVTAAVEPILDFLTAPAPAPASMEQFGIVVDKVVAPAQEERKTCVNAEPPASKEKFKKPKILIVGMLDEQVAAVRRKWPQVEITSFSSQRSASERLGTLCKANELVIVVVKFVSHSTYGLVKEHANKWAHCNGLFSETHQIIGDFLHGKPSQPPSKP